MNEDPTARLGNLAALGRSLRELDESMLPIAARSPRAEAAGPAAAGEVQSQAPPEMEPTPPSQAALLAAAIPCLRQVLMPRLSGPLPADPGPDPAAAAAEAAVDEDALAPAATVTVTVLAATGLPVAEPHWVDS